VSVVAPDCLRVQSDEICIFRHATPETLPWQRLGIDLVLECTGVFQTRIDAERHRAAGAARVLFSHPAEADVDRTVVFGVNHDALEAEDRIVSNASCTTNAIVPVLDALHRAFTIEQGMLTTVHSAMNDQPTIDAYHHHDLRRTRSSMQNIVPVQTGLAKGVERLLPELAGLLSAVAVRVPTINVSAIDLTLNVARTVTPEQVNRVLQAAAAEGYCGVLAYTEEPLASSDFNHVAVSATVDGSQTRVSNGRLIKVWVWFDNEWAFANRMLDVAGYWLAKT
jgi:glyceraldehyde 3-phosphate dehydrogenase/D-erythrose 4-phosphate dehydrogenase